MKCKLMDLEQLLQHYPALRSKKGKNGRYRLDWLIRNRRIPIVKIGRRNYFDPDEIDAWIQSKKIPMNEVE